MKIFKVVIDNLFKMTKRGNYENWEKFKGIKRIKRKKYF